MSKSDRAKKRQIKRTRYAKPSAPRAIGANDNVRTANDNAPPVTIRGVELSEGQAYRFANAEVKLASADLAVRREGHRIMDALDRELDALIGARAAEANLEELRGLERLRGLEIGVSKHQGTAGRTPSLPGWAGNPADLGVHYLDPARRRPSLPRRL